MIEDEQPWLGFSCEIGQLGGGRVVFGRKLLKPLGPRRQPRRRVRFVNQHIAAVAGINRCLRWIRVARDDDTAIRRFEAVAVTLHSVFRGEGSDRHVLILVNLTGLYFMSIHLVTVGECALVAIGIGACLDVDPVSFKKVFGHGLEPNGAVNFPRNTTSNRPRRKDQVRVADCVIGVKMGNERDPQTCRFERLYTSAHSSGFGTPRQARSR